MRYYSDDMQGYCEMSDSYENIISISALGTKKIANDLIYQSLAIFVFVFCHLLAFSAFFSRK